MEVFKMATLWTCAHTLIIAWAVVFVLSSSLLITSCRPKAERVIVFLCRVSFVESDPVMVDLSWFVESGQRYLAVAFVRLTCLWFPCSSELLSRRFNVISCDEWFRMCFLYLFRSKESFESFNVDIVRLQMLRFVKSFARRKGLRRTMVVLRMPMLWTCAQTLIISWAVCAIVFIVDNTFCRTKAERVFVFLLSWFFCWTYPWRWNMCRIRQTKTCCCFFRLCLWIHVLVFRASVSKVQWFFLRWVISIVPSQFV